MKIQMVGSDFRWYNESYLEAFRRFDCEVHLSKSSFQIDKRNYKTRIKRLLGFPLDKELQVMQEKRDQSFLEDYLNFKPDLVFVRTGNQVSESFLSRIKGETPVFLYITDAISAEPRIEKTIKYYDKVFTYETSDIEIIKKYGIPYETMFGSFDPKQYYHIPLEKEIDVFFVGFMYPERIEILKKLSCDFKDYNLRFYGPLIPKKRYIKRLIFRLSKFSKSFVNSNLGYREVNTFYNKSKISLNLHHSQTTNGWNTRTCEIMATGSFEIVNDNPAISEEFGDCCGTFNSYDDLRSQIHYYLNNADERDRKSKIAMEKVHQFHTIDKDIARILSSFEEMQQ